MSKAFYFPAFYLRAGSTGQRRVVLLEGRQAWVCIQPGPLLEKRRHFKGKKVKGRVKKMAFVGELTHTDKVTRVN